MNPSVDSCSYHLSNVRGDRVVETGAGYFITLEDGRKAIKLYHNSAMNTKEWSERFGEINGPSNEMPAHELPGIHFQEPQSATWIAQHRTKRG